MYLRATEPDPETGVRRDLPLNPRHSAGIDLLWEIEGRARIGVEAFYTGRQPLDDSPYRTDSLRYWLFGLIGESRAGPARIFVNAENLAGFGRPAMCRSSCPPEPSTEPGSTTNGAR